MRGPYFDELTLGQTVTSQQRIITQADVVLFASLARLESPLFNDPEQARSHGYEGCLVPGPLVFAYSIGLTEETTHQTVIAALRFDDLVFHAPTYHGEGLRVTSEVTSLRASSSRPNTGVVQWKHSVHKQDGTLVCDYLRTMLYGSRAYFEAGDS